MKARELLEKTKPVSSEEEEPRRHASQEEKVNEAYDNISRKLEALRKGPVVVDKDDENKFEEEQVSPEEPESLEAPENPEEPESLEAPENPEEPESPEGQEDEDMIVPDERIHRNFGIPAHTEDSPVDTMDDLAREQLHIPNLHSPKPTLNFHYRERGSQVEKKSSKRILILGLIGLGVIAAIVYLLKNQPSGSKTPSSSPSITRAVITTTPAPTPVPGLSKEDRAKFTVRVLNGTTKTGLAASVSAQLKELGYKTGKTGNATNSAFTKTLVRVKASAQALADQLVADLAGQFDAASSSAALKDSDTVDAEIILGTR